MAREVEVYAECIERLAEKHDLTKMSDARLRMMIEEECGLPMIPISMVRRVRALTGRGARIVARGGGGIVSPESTHYPAYTFAEILLIGVYQENPAEAHSIVYRLLEPILINPELPVKLKSAWFIPVYRPESLQALSSLVVEGLKLMPENDRKTACRAIARAFRLMVEGMEEKGSGRADVPLHVLQVVVPEPLVDACSDAGVRWE